MTKTKTPRWIQLLLAIAALAGFTGLCQAQTPPINISFDSGVPSQFYDGGSPNNPGGYVNYFWQSTNGPDGANSGCEVYQFDGTNDQEIDPAFNVSFNTAQYQSITFQLKIDPGSGTIGNPLLSFYGNMQLSVRDASYSWNGEGYQSVYGPAANQWVTYTVGLPANVQAAHLQIQLQGGAAYSGPVKVYIGNVSVLPPPNPDILEATNSTVAGTWQNYGLASSWDTAADAPYINPVTGAGPTSLAPAGSMEFQSSQPNGYQGGNFYTSGFNASQYQWVGMDVYYDGPTTPTNDYAGFQMAIVNSSYSWINIGHVNFTAGMVGHWTHVDLPCAASGVTGALGFAIQSTPGSTAGNNPITWHMDNFELWSPEVHPQILSLTKNTTPGGLEMAVDGDGSANEFDQEGITTPSATNNVANFFWIGQEPATYAFTLTNFPAPAAAPGFEAHAYVINGDTFANVSQSFSYNETYSGPNFNAVDGIWFEVENGTNGGVNANLLWKTNAPNSNMTNGIFCAITNLASANGNWALNFTSDTAGTITYNGTVVTNFTLPAFTTDPSYSANFQPTTSMVQFGVWKNDSNTNTPGRNDNQSAIFTSVLATNTTVAISDNFSGSSLTASNAWQIAEYYQFAANRTTLIPAGTAFWMTWNTSQSGFVVQSSTDLQTWAPAGVTFTYIDGTGTNTIGAIPSSTLPAGGADFFELLK